MNIHIVSVIYKKAFSDSPTLLSLARCLEQSTSQFNISVSLDIWNNSPENFECGSIDKKLTKTLPVRIIHTPHNENLSKIYNQSINFALKGTNKPDFYIILDDDTELDSSYFETLFAALKTHRDTPLFAPLIFSGHDQRLVSPHSKQNNKIKPGIQPSKGVKCITSGLALNTKIFGACQFDERFTIYGADIDICHQLRALYSDFYILDYKLNHDLSSEASETESLTAWRRMEKLQAEFLLSKKYKSHSSYVFRVLKHSAKEFFYSLQKTNVSHFMHLMRILKYTFTH